MRTHRQNTLDIFSGFWLALDPKKVILGTVMVLTTIVLVFLMISMTRFWYPQAGTLSMHAMSRTTDGATLRLFGKWAAGCRMTDKERGEVGENKLVILTRAIKYKVCPPANVQLSLSQRAGAVLYMTGCGLILLALWSYFGGAISRMTAVDFARGERVDVQEATAFSKKKFGSFFWAPITPFIFAALFVCANLLLGAVGRIPAAGPVIMGICYVLAVVSSFVALILCLGGIFGMVNMWPTIAMEGTDVFDALSRSYNYFFQKPVRTFWYMLVACAFGIVSILAISCFACCMLKLTQASVAWGMGGGYDLMMEGNTWPYRIGLVAKRVVEIMVWGLVLGYAASYKLSSWTIIYSLLRRRVDGTDMQEVYLPEEETPPAPAAVPPTA